MKYEIIERNAFQVVGIKEKFSCATKENDAVTPKLWSKANNDGIIDTLAQLNNGQNKGILGITDTHQEAENIMDYWIATEFNGDVPDGFSSLEIPASKWVVFVVQGPIPEAIVSTWKQIFSEWFPSHRYEPAEIASLEEYMGAYPNPSCKIWVPIK
ncbi:GyrI-like domain-containing protein [Peribacillus frigoritolerans]